MYSNSKLYHIIIKGIDSQDIFYDDQDRRVFLKKLLLTKEEYDNHICAYCLMDNHIHLVIRIEKEFLSKAMQTLMIKYVRYFNKKYERTGTLVQNRFKSKNIENLDYFFRVCRYVHRNPENAWMAKTEDYEWSSYQEYLKEGKIVDKEILLHYFNDDINEFIKYTAEDENINETAEFEILGKLKDDEVLGIIMEKFEFKDVNEVQKFFKNCKKNELERYIKKIKKIKGTTKTQVARVLRINRKRLKEMWDN